MNYAEDSSQPKVAATIPSKLDSLRNVINTLNESTNILHHSLSPVLAPARPEPSNGGVPADPATRSTSELAEVLDEYVYMLQVILDRNNEIQSRLEL